MWGINLKATTTTAKKSEHFQFEIIVNILQ